MMSSPLEQMIYFALLAVIALAALVFLRMLSVYRENEIETYDLVHKAKSLRAEYNRQLQQRDDA